MRVVRWRPHKGMCFLERSLGGAFIFSSFGWGPGIFCLEILPMVPSSHQICSPDLSYEPRCYPYFGDDRLFQPALFLTVRRDTARKPVPCEAYLVIRARLARVARSVLPVSLTIHAQEQRNGDCRRNVH